MQTKTLVTASEVSSATIDSHGDSRDPASGLYASVWEAPRVTVTDARGGSLRTVLDDLRRSGIVRCEVDDEARVLEAFEGCGGCLAPQYEAVQAGQADASLLETVAKAMTAPGATSASKAASTEFHMDGYQFRSPYRGQPIAGIGSWPDVEVLAFPRVVERRILVFADIAEAVRTFLRNHEATLFEQLARPVFTVSDRYRDADPTLEEPGFFSVVRQDHLGWRFHLGGSIESPDPDASFSLGLLRSYVAGAAITVPLESRDLFVIDQRRVAHRGLRLPGMDGLTVLRRRLIRFTDATPRRG